jgi:hypothetical protein
MGGYRNKKREGLISTDEKGGDPRRIVMQNLEQAKSKKNKI